MAKKATSALHELFVAVRRVIVLVVAAFALAMDWPLTVVATRVVILWAGLVVLSHAAELMFQYLSHQAMLQQSQGITQESSGGAQRS